MLKFRSLEKEILDGNNYSKEELFQNLKELEIINSKLGGNKINKKGFQYLSKNKEQLRVLEVGCGGGDNLSFLQKKFPNNQFYGSDINPYCIEYSNKNRKANLEFFLQDAFELTEKYDIIYNSLFCHHFSDDELVIHIKKLYQLSNLGLFINDLERNPIAYYSIKFLSKIFSKSRLVKNDAPLSVKRGFKKREWEVILKKAGITNYKIKWCWAFRWLIIIPNESK